MKYLYHIITFQEAHQMNTPEKKHVLVIDDNIMLLRTVKDMLRENYSVSISVSSYQAFDAIKIKKPDVILLDYEMPMIDGAETIKKLREHEESKDIPVIFFTSSAKSETVTMLIKLNPAGYILKPPNKQKLIEQIEKALAK